MEKWGEQKSLDPRDDGAGAHCKGGNGGEGGWHGGQGQTLVFLVCWGWGRGGGGDGEGGGWRGGGVRGKRRESLL